MPAFIPEFIAAPIESILNSQTVKNATEAINGAVNTITEPESKAAGRQKRLKASNYEYTYVQFPSNLGEGLRHPYYMTFFINVQDLSKWARGPFDTRALTADGRKIHSTVSTHQQSQRTLSKNAGSTSLGFGRKTSRTKAAIRLAMPDTLSWSFVNSFSNVNLTGLPFVREAAALASIPALSKSMSESHQKGGIMGFLSSLNKSNEARSAIGPLAEIAGNALLGAGGDQLVLSAAGVAINPQVDVIYESPSLRDFNFDFLFAPRDVDEAKQVADILRLFKFHSAPEMLGQGIGLGRYMVPPSEFDIEFSVNTMGKISTCVLQNVTVDYAPSGAAFYADGQPVYTRLTLQFRELEFITKTLIAEEGY